MSVAGRALAAVGARFRLHGRDPASGIDCVGLVAWCLGVAVPNGYRLRGGRVSDVQAVATRLGVVMIDEAQPGDILLLASGPGQLHLAVQVAGGIVHADAGLRRVVERPGSPPWPVLAIWRTSQE